MKSSQILLGLAFICSLGLTQTIASTSNLSTQTKPLLEIYESPTCGCCKLWGEYMSKNGFEVKEIKTNELLKIKEQYQIKQDFMSCHTGVIDGYVIEGHIPHEQVQRLLSEKPKDVIGITTPGMPQGSPGMEQGMPDDTYNVILLYKDGSSKIYATYKGHTKIKEY